MYNLIKSFNTISNKNYKVINYKSNYLSNSKKNYYIFSKKESNMFFVHNNLKLFDLKRNFSNYIFINKFLIKKICFFVINQKTFNLKINVFGSYNNFFFSVGIILIYLKAFKKKLRKSLKSYRLLISYLNNKLSYNKINLSYILLKNSKKNSFIVNFLIKNLNLSNYIFFYKPNNFIITTLKNKKSIKKKIKKKLLLKNNVII